MQPYQRGIIQASYITLSDKVKNMISPSIPGLLVPVNYGLNYEELLPSAPYIQGLLKEYSANYNEVLLHHPFQDYCG